MSILFLVRNLFACRASDCTTVVIGPHANLTSESGWAVGGSCEGIQRIETCSVDESFNEKVDIVSVLRASTAYGNRSSPYTPQP
ncbi:hypothetical protein GGF50DRAFT_121810 [Schizophyllum commune]